MDSIDYRALEKVAAMIGTLGFTLIHTVTVTVNGQHGGMDVTVAGDRFDQEDEQIVAVDAPFTSLAPDPHTGPSAAYLRGQLSAAELDLLASYQPGQPRIWDATALLPRVYNLLALGLIYHDHRDKNSYAYRLTALGEEVTAL